MYTSQIIANIARHITLSEADQARFTSLLEEQTVLKNEYLLRQGNRCQHIYFINNGTIRAYFLNANGKESTIMFAIRDWWITDMHCFLNELPAMVNIKAVEKSDILSLKRKDLDQLYEDVPAFNKFFRILMQNAYCREQLRMIENLSLPALERYQNFLNKYPQIANQVPLKQIATYLGVTPEFLSTIRAGKK